jgi:predicted dehydrogenase
VTKIRVGVIGAGVFGRHHLRILGQSAGAELAGVVDIDAGRAEAAASEYGCPAYPSIESLGGKIDAAVVAAPTSKHAEIGCALLENGIDVLVENRSHAISPPQDFSSILLRDTTASCKWATWNVSIPP